MNLSSEIDAAIQSDLSVGNESTLFPLATIQLAKNRAYAKCAALFRWPETEDAKVTTTQDDVDYYDYPQTWRPDSIIKLKVDGVDYGDPLTFEDYQYELENSFPSGLTKIWANQWRRYFIYPAPVVAGLEIVVFGQRSVEDLTDDDGANPVTIWSYSMPECNEAVVKEAVAILRAKGDDVKVAKSGQTIGNMLSMEAQGILANAWNGIRKSQTKYRKTRSEFVIPDFFGDNSTDDI